MYLAQDEHSGVSLVAYSLLRLLPIILHMTSDNLRSRKYAVQLARKVSKKL